MAGPQTVTEVKTPLVCPPEEVFPTVTVTLLFTAEGVGVLTKTTPEPTPPPQLARTIDTSATVRIRRPVRQAATLALGVMHHPCTEVGRHEARNVRVAAEGAHMATADEYQLG